MKWSKHDEDLPPIVQHLGELAARHKLVPFLGAGASLGHVNVDWDAITLEMASELGITAGENPQVAQEFVNAKGRDNLCSKLAKHLTVSQFSDENGVVPLAIISLGIGTVYTTNQDNVFELCADKYGREVKRVIELSDLAESLPGDYLFYKYHGDLGNPESIVFTEDDYQQRINDVDHFMNVRLRADLLAKNFLFVGYSFRDRNIRETFRQLQAAFRGALPKSFLIAFQYDEALQDLSQSFGVTAIDPRSAYPHLPDNATAFSEFLSDLTKSTFRSKVAADLANMFVSRTPPTMRVVTRYEVQALLDGARCVERSEAIGRFRALLDQSLVPQEFQSDVVAAFRQMARQCQTIQESNELKNALFNLRLGGEALFECYALCYTTTRVRQTSGMWDIYRPHANNLPEAMRAMAASRAVEILSEWEAPINGTFRSHLEQAIRDYEQLPMELQEYVRAAVDFAWKGEKGLTHPLKRLGAPMVRRLQSFEEIHQEMASILPKRFRRPREG